MVTSEVFDFSIAVAFLYTFALHSDLFLSLLIDGGDKVDLTQNFLPPLLLSLPRSIPLSTLWLLFTIS